MRAFEIYLNGRKLCTAGINEAGVVTSAVTWVTGVNTKEPEDIELRVGGLVSSSNTFVDWTHRILKEGDELRIVVCQKKKVSKPTKIRTETERMRKKGKLLYLKRLSKELGYEIKKK